VSARTLPAELYGLRGPRWYVRLRGLRWLAHGFCPCCYSSPPRPTCPVCYGEGEYGPDGMTPYRRELWRRRWATLSRPG